MRSTSQPIEVFDARNDDGFSADVAARLRAQRKDISAGGNRFAETGPHDCAIDLWKFLSTSAQARLRAAADGIETGRSSSFHDVESLGTPGSVLWSSMRGRNPAHVEFAIASA